MGLRTLKGFGALKLFFWFVCLRVNTVVKVGGDMYKKKMIYLHTGTPGGVKSSKQRAEVSTLSSVESVKMRCDD